MNRGLRFFGFYFFMAVAGSLLIVFGAPFVKMPEPVARMLVGLDQNAALQKRVVALRSALAWRTPPSVPPSPAVNPDPAPVQTPSGIQAGEKTPPAIAARVKGRRAAGAGGHAPPPAAPPIPEVTEPAAEPLEQVPEARKDTNRWGVVVALDAKVYSLQGKCQAHVGAGTLLDIRDVVSANAGTFARAGVISSSNFFDDALVAMADIEVRSGSLGELRTKERELYIAQARVTAELELHGSDCTKYVRKDSPPGDEYVAARQHYVELVKAGRALMAKREAATGIERMRCEDELRQMKGEEVRSSQKYEKSKRQYEEWSRANPEPTGLEKEEVDALKEQAERIRKDLESLAAEQP